MANTKKRLSSKGLDKIFGVEFNDVIQEIEHNKSLQKNSFSINLSEIHINPYQPRKVFDQKELENLSDSIKTHGLIQPVIVTKSVQGYTLVAGERRLRATKMAGLQEIKCIVVDFTDEQIKQIALIENIQRVDLNSIEEAIAYEEIIKSTGIKQEELGEKVNKSRSHIANTMRLLRLPKEIQQQILDNKLKMGQVKPLLKISDPKKQINLAKNIIDNKLSSRQVENLLKTKSVHLKNKNSKNENITYLEESIINKLKTKVEIKSNKISIHYTSDDDLNRLLEIMNLVI